MKCEIAIFVKENLLEIVEHCIELGKNVKPDLSDPSLKWLDAETKEKLLNPDEKIVWVFPENHDVFNLFIELLNLSVWRVFIPPMGGQAFYQGFDWAQIHPYWQLSGKKPIKEENLHKLHFLERKYCEELNK